MKLSPEGNIFVFPLMIMTGLLILFWSMGYVTIYLPSFIGLILLFCLNFFRDPKRLVPEGKNQIVSPADGKIIRIDTENEEFQIISIFLNVLRVNLYYLLKIFNCFFFFTLFLK